GNRTGHKKTTPARLMHVCIVDMTYSPGISRAMSGITKYVSRSSLSSMVATGSRNDGSGCTRMNSCPFGFRTGTVTSAFLTPTPSAKLRSMRNRAGSNGLGGSPPPLDVFSAIWFLLSDGVRRNARRAPSATSVAGFRLTLPTDAIDGGRAVVVSSDPQEPRERHSAVGLLSGPPTTVHHWQPFSERMHASESSTLKDATAALALEERQAQQHDHDGGELEHTLDKRLCNHERRVGDNGLATDPHLLLRHGGAD